MYSDTDSDSQSDLSDEEKRRRAAKALRKSKKLRARRKAEERKMKRRLGETKEEQGPMGDDEGEKALEKLASTYIKEDATGKVILDTSATDFFDKMTAYRKNEEIREHMRARMAEEEEQANKLQKEQIASAAQASALLASESASTSNSPSTSLSPPSSACAPHTERNKGRQSVSGASQLLPLKKGAQKRPKAEHILRN